MNSALSSTHRRRQLESIDEPDGRGAFSSTLLPDVYPLVIDANVLRDEILRTASKSQRTVLLNAANYGVLRLFCAPHVIEEVEEHLAEWSAQKGLPVADVRTVWTSHYLPLLRCVDPPQGLTTAAEQERLDALADRRSGHGDPDDVPTATLSLLLNAPLLSRDRHALTAVYGARLNYDAHVQWMSRIRAGGNLVVATQLMVTLPALGLGLGSAALDGVKAASTKLGWPYLLFGSAALAAAAHTLVPTKTRQRMLTAMKSGLEAFFEVFAELVLLREEAQSELESMQPDQPPWSEVASQLDTQRCLARASLHQLARSPHSLLSAAELHVLVLRLPAGAGGQAAVRTALRTWPLFDEPYHGRFQAGRPAGRTLPAPPE